MNSEGAFIPSLLFYCLVAPFRIIRILCCCKSHCISHIHISFAPQEVKDRLCVGPKDTEDAVRKVIAQFSVFADEIADFYEEAQRINADQDPHTVFESIESMIVNPLPKKLIMLAGLLTY